MAYLPERGDMRSMRTIVNKLRSKLAMPSGNPTYSVTESRVGYRMAKGDIGMGGGRIAQRLNSPIPTLFREEL